MTNEYNIALLSGDGVGPELVDSARQVLLAVEKRFKRFHLEFKKYPFGKTVYDQTGRAIPAETLAGVKSCRAAVLGAFIVSGMPVAPMGLFRREMGFFADVRAARPYAGVWSLKPDIDLVCIREITQGFLPDRNLYKGHGEFMPNQDVAISLRVITRQACERIARFAFEYARKNRRHSITVPQKKHIFQQADALFLGVIAEIGREYPEIQVRDEAVDTTANRLISCPEQYDVILATNLFGDILSDVAAALVSSLMAISNIGSDNALFMPLGHDPKMDEVGKGVVNPLSFLLCVVPLLEYLEQTEAAESLHRALRECIREGLLASHSTTEVIKAVCEKL